MAEAGEVEGLGLGEVIQRLRTGRGQAIKRDLLCRAADLLSSLGGEIKSLKGELAADREAADIIRRASRLMLPLVVQVEQADARAQSAEALSRRLREALEDGHATILGMETAALVGRTNDQWERAFRSGLKSARQVIGAKLAALNPPASGRGEEHG